MISDETAYIKIISCTKIIELKHLGKFMYKLRCKWENQEKIPVQD